MNRPRSDGGVGPALGDWPDRLLPLCEINPSAFWYLDCRSDEGLLVFDRAPEGVPDEKFAATGRTLRSWLEAWIAGIDVVSEALASSG